MAETIRFCVDCPHVPEGVIAEVKDVVLPSNHNARATMSTKLADKYPDSYRLAIDTATITSVAVEALPGSGVEVGEEAELRVRAYGGDETSVKERILACEHPRKGKIARLLGQKGTCQAVTKTI